jgi:hypothetical protein
MASHLLSESQIARDICLPMSAVKQKAGGQDFKHEQVRFLAHVQRYTHAYADKH